MPTVIFQLQRIQDYKMGTNIINGVETVHVEDVTADNNVTGADILVGTSSLKVKMIEYSVPTILATTSTTVDLTGIQRLNHYALGYAFVDFDPVQIDANFQLDTGLANWKLRMINHSGSATGIFDVRVYYVDI